MARSAAKLAARADDGDIIDKKAHAQPLKYIGKTDSDVAELDQTVLIFVGARSGQVMPLVGTRETSREKLIKIGGIRFIACSDVCGDDAWGF